jgi:SsrA-binding protein
MQQEHEKLVCQNKKAYHDYFIDETYEAGIVLEGSEVKSLRQGKASIKEAHARIENGEAWLYDMYIARYEQGAQAFAPPERRKRKLLLKKAEIQRLIGKSREKGYTLVPLKVYFKGPYAKLLIGLARGKKKYDKRAALAERDAARELARARALRAKEGNA